MVEEIEGRDYVACQVCGGKFKFLGIHLTRTHNMTKEQYLELYPNSLLICSVTSQQRSKGQSGKNNPMYGKKGEDNPNFGRKHSDTTREKMSASAIERYEDSLEHEKSSKAAIKRFEDNPITDITRKKMSESATVRWKDPLEREKASEIHIKQWKDPKVREKMLESQKKRWEDLKEHEKMSEVIKKYFENNPETFIERGKHISAGHQGISYDEWDHFLCDEKVYWKDWHNIIYLNGYFQGCHRHHVTKTIVACIPSKLHKHIYHNLKTGQGTAEMNMLALQFINGCYDD